MENSLQENVQNIKQDLNEKINEKIKTKREVVHNLRRLNKKLKYLKIEKEALEKLLNDYNEQDLQKLQIKLKSLEFKIQTKALTAKREKELLKDIVEIEKKIAEYRPMIKAKKRKKIVDEEISKLEQLIKQEQEKFEQLTKEIGALLKERKEAEKGKGGHIAQKHALSLTDVIVVEKKNEDKKTKKADKK
ncbi:MAG: hypothetical protein QXI89_00005 [Candidatus Anstonellales archaeon]